MNFSNLFSKATIVIVTFKSFNIIEKCITNLNKNFNILIVENSADTKFTSNLEQKYNNVKCINIGYDSGFGYALNRGVEKVKTEYFISMNPDTFPQGDCLEKLINVADSRKDVAMVTPLTLLKQNTKEFSAYGYFKKRNIVKSAENLLEVDWVNGNIFLMKKLFFQEIGSFDEKIFIEYDERELQRRIFLNNKKVLINFNAKSQHLDGKSADEEFSFQMKCERSWHNAWSGFYYYKKHFGIIYSLYKCLPFAVANLIKFIIYFIIQNKKKSKIYKLFFLGFFYSLTNQKSSYRAEID